MPGDLKDDSESRKHQTHTQTVESLDATSDGERRDGTPVACAPVEGGQGRAALAGARNGGKLPSIRSPNDDVGGGVEPKSIGGWSWTTVLPERANAARRQPPTDGDQRAAGAGP